MYLQYVVMYNFHQNKMERRKRDGTLELIVGMKLEYYYFGKKTSKANYPK